MREAQEFANHDSDGGWFSRLSAGLSKSASKLTQNIGGLFTKSRLDDNALEALEEALLSADLGPQTAARIMNDFSAMRFEEGATDTQIRRALAQSMSKILAPVAKPLIFQRPEQGPLVVLVCGVNGAGKTTTIGKLAHHWHYGAGRKVMLAAGDTFRAAAVEQLQEWANRSGSLLLAKDIGADAAALAFEAYERAKAENCDILMIDTAGRLQNKSNLMAELEKIIRVLKKHGEDLPHACLLVLDATTGQNAFSQVETFKEMVKVSGLIVTKLDGSAKGGVVVGLADKFGLPVHFIGVGEQIEDLQPFDPDAYARALVGLR
ncbi:MAG: signal recognition particle-docking protein FtsY [Alphaproteobacteria bacterium]|nr:signal recognition particle-docking protein FtsY [Alphaproteobacteria bacterium]